MRHVVVELPVAMFCDTDRVPFKVKSRERTGFVSQGLFSTSMIQPFACVVFVHSFFQPPTLPILLSFRFQPAHLQRGCSTQQRCARSWENGFSTFLSALFLGRIPAHNCLPRTPGGMKYQRGWQVYSSRASV